MVESLAREGQEGAGDARGSTGPSRRLFLPAACFRSLEESDRKKARRKDGKARPKERSEWVRRPGRWLGPKAMGGSAGRLRPTGAPPPKPALLVRRRLTASPSS